MLIWKPSRYTNRPINAWYLYTRVAIHKTYLYKYIKHIKYKNIRKSNKIDEKAVSHLAPITQVGRRNTAGGVTDPTYAVEEAHLIAVRAVIDGSLELGRHPDLGLEHSGNTTGQHALSEESTPSAATSTAS